MHNIFLAFLVVWRNIEVLLYRLLISVIYHGLPRHVPGHRKTTKSCSGVGNKNVFSDSFHVGRYVFCWYVSVDNIDNMSQV